MKSMFPAAFLACFAFLSACSKANDAAKSAAAPAAPVTVALVAQEDTPIELRTIGSVEPVNRVVLRPQVAGRVLELVAVEGSDVATGQEIIRLDRRPFEIVLREAQANLARTQAAAQDARNNVGRLTLPQAALAVSERDIEAARAQLAAAEADVASGEARVASARLDLEYCSLSAPFAGRLGAFLVKAGATVKENDTDIVEIIQFDPIDVTFTVPEERLTDIRRALAVGDVAVEATPTGSNSGVVGRLTFVDSSVSQSTGSVRMKATFANEDRGLWPRQFVSVAIRLGIDRGSVVVPEAAVQRSQSGGLVYVVKSDQTVEARTVTVRRTIAGRCVIETGLNAGETVVTDGQLRLAPGVSVRIKDAPAAATKSGGEAP